MKRRKDIILQYIVLSTAIFQLLANYSLQPEFQRTSIPTNPTEILFLPAPFAFAIWVPIILSTTIYSFYQILHQFTYNKRAKQTAPYFIILNLGFVAWLVFASQTGIYFSPNFSPNALFGTVVVIIIMMITAGKLYFIVDNYKATSGWLDTIRNIAVPLYYSWLIIATSANITTYLYTLSFDIAFSDEIWAIIVLILTAGISILTAVKTRHPILYGLFSGAALWSLIGIIIANLEKSSLIVLTSSVVTVVYLAVLTIKLRILNTFIAKLKILSKKPD
jgi:hypothetical protein